MQNDKTATIQEEFKALSEGCEISHKSTFIVNVIIKTIFQSLLSNMRVVMKTFCWLLRPEIKFPVFLLKLNIKWARECGGGAGMESILGMLV